MLHVNDLTYRIAGRLILNGATVHVPPGHKVGVVGPNGAGKSTLLKLIAGDLAPESGTIRLQRAARLGIVAQEAPAGPQSLTEVVLAADRERARLMAELDGGATPERAAEVHQRLVDIGAHAGPARAARILDGLGFDAAAQERPVGDFSGGWRMRVALAAMLFAEPDLLLLDEPTNYLDLEGVMWLEGFLKHYPRTVLLVSHDREILNKAVSEILHVDRGRLTLYRGGYDEFLRQRAEAQMQQEKLRQRQEAQRKHMQAFVDRFRAQATKARQAQSRLKALAKLPPVAEVEEDRRLSFAFPAPSQMASPLITMEGVAVGYRPDEPVLKRVTLRLDADDRIALLGRNGNGKSTFCKLLAGRLQTQAGSVVGSQKVRVAYFAQHQIEDLDATITPVQHLMRLLPGEGESRVRARLGAFGLEGDKAQTGIAELSGGERARLVLCTICVVPPHLLLLDEPTNHLDIAAREALIEALNNYAGAVVLVSHDPHLLELAADRLWLVADGTVRNFEGDLDDYRRYVLSDAAGDDGPRERGPDSRGNRKQDRREEARMRRQLAPLRQAVTAAERRLEALQQKQASIEYELADPKLYDAPPARLADVNRRHADLKREIAGAEAAWLAANDALDAAEAEAQAGVAQGS